GQSIVNGGALEGNAQASGTPFASGTTALHGGTLRVTGVGTISPGVGTTGTLAFGGPAKIVVDNTPSTLTTTLTIPTLAGRVAGTAGTLVLVPQSGGFNTTEIFSVTN